MSEPAHLLEIMSRHAGFAAMICLVGGGQEIHDGEGGLAEWGDALRACGEWRVLAAPDIFANADPRQRLGILPDLRFLPELHLAMSVRQIRFTEASAWVNHVLAGDKAAAVRIAEDLQRKREEGCIVVIVCDRGDRYFAPMKWERRYIW